MLRLNVHTQFRMAFDMVYFCRYIYRCLIPGSFGHTRLDRVSGSPILVGDDECIGLGMMRMFRWE